MKRKPRWPGDSSKEVTTFGGLRRRELMSLVRSTGNKTTEERLAKLLRKNGLSGWRRHQAIVGRPDFVWSTKRLVVFVDGCFWHGHRCKRGSVPKTNRQAWLNKIEGNKLRDKRIAKRLRSMNWRVIRIWECDLSTRPDSSISRIRRRLNG